jgi:thioester reductase-like protein
LTPERRILVTGATGLIGGELLRPLLDCPGTSAWALVRPQAGADAESRLTERLQRSGTGLEPPLHRLVAVAGDMTAKDLGLPAEHRERISSSVDVIVHCAAETSFIRDEWCHRINVGGMANLIAFAQRCRRNPLIVHVSTATVCGAVRDQSVSEDFSCDPGGHHYNEYTRSKSMAERMLRASGLRFLILRPSIVVSAGIRDHGFASTMLWWLPLLNRLDAVPIDPDARLDMVTVSFVAQSILAVIDSVKRRHDCYHISAGWEDATVMSQAGQFLDAYYDRPEPLQLFRPDEWTREVHRHYIRTPEQRKVFSALRHYLPFINMNVAYDSTRLRCLLGSDLPEIEPFDSYAGSLLEVMSPELIPRS